MAKAPKKFYASWGLSLFCIYAMLACVDAMPDCLYIIMCILGRFPFVFQKESFWVVKGLLLERKTNPFGMQKDPFWNVKGVLLLMWQISCGMYGDMSHLLFNNRYLLTM